MKFLALTKMGSVINREIYVNAEHIEAMEPIISDNTTGSRSVIGTQVWITEAVFDVEQTPTEIFGLMR